MVKLLTLSLILSAAGKGQAPEKLPFGFSHLEIFKVGERTRNLTSADLNQDGLTDVLLIDQGKTAITVLAQRSEKEKAEPEPTDINEVPSDLRFKREDRITERALYSLVVGDFNGDGRADLAFHGDPPGLTVQLGGTAWEKRKKLSVRNPLPGRRSLLKGDLDGDGKEDLLLLTDEGYVVWQWKNGPVRTGRVPVPAKKINFAQLSDLSGDGIPDLIYGLQSKWPLRVRLGRKGGFGPEVAFEVEGLRLVEVGDVLPEKGQEVVTVQDNPLRIGIYRLGRRESQESLGQAQLYVACAEAGKVRGVEVGDVNEDGLPDLLCLLPGSSELGVFLGAKSKVFKPLKTWPTLHDPKGLILVRRGKQTYLIVGSEREEAIGVCKWSGRRITFPKLLVLEGKPLALATVKYGKEKIPVVAVQKGSRSSALSFLDMGEEISLGASVEVSGRVEDLLPLDLEGDGKQEILCFVAYRSPVLVKVVEEGGKKKLRLIQPGAARLLERIARASVGVLPRPKGGEDLIVAAGSILRIVRISGEKFEVVDQYSGGSGADLAFPAAGEIAGKGLKIIAFDKSEGGLVLLSKGPDGIFRPTELVRVPYTPTAPLEFADLDKDGRKEILYPSAQGPVLLSPKSKGYALRPVTYFEVKDRKKVRSIVALALGDLNGDRRKDIVYVTEKNVEFRVLDLRGNRLLEALRFRIFEEKGQTAEGRFTSRRSSGVRELFIKDVTQDGLEDALLLVHDRLLLYVQDKIPSRR